MILTLILAAAAGYATRIAEPRILEGLTGLIGQDRLASKSDQRVAVLLICLLAAALVLWLGTSGGNSVAFVIGAALGYFQEQIRDGFSKSAD